jgi:hypothetical protein
VTAAPWRRRGLLAPAPSGAVPWAASHAALPAVAPRLDGATDELDLYLSCRDGDSRARIGRATLTVGGEAPTVGPLAPEPVLDLGALGAFDDSGVTMSCVVDRDDGTRLLFYSGWSLGVSVPFYFYVGLAASDDGGQTFRRLSRGPLLERDDVDPFLTASPTVLRDGGVWRMWYVSGDGWRLVDGVAEHRYKIRYAESEDGLRWRRDGRTAIEFRDASEYAMGRPCVVKDADRYRMWFCARGDSYRLAYAESHDGLTWERDDGAATLDGVPGDWEREMQAYPFVFSTGGRFTMLYNGNGYGRSGVGWATLEAERA